MKFRTEVLVEPKVDLISYDTSIMSIGSCFAEEIGNKLASLKFKIEVNPFGILFNSVSMCEMISNIFTSQIETEMMLERDAVFYHYGYHSKLNANSKEELQLKISKLQNQTKIKLSESKIVIITLGTSWVYRHKELNRIVANCHKIPQSQFSKELLSVNENYESLQKMVDIIRAINDQAKIIFTVSPVRHIKDGIHENNLSKSTLLLAVDETVRKNKNVIYFPAYELLLDDLRDYRFYKADMIHPTEQAVEFIFEKIKTAYMNETTLQKMIQVEKDLKLTQHKKFEQI